MKLRHFLFSLLALLSSITASAYEWTDDNGTVWTFTTSGNTASIYKKSFQAAVSGTIPTNLVIPSTLYIGNSSYTVTSIGESAFTNCSSLTSVTIPSSVTSIGEYAFQNCVKLTSVTIPSSVTKVGAYAFSDCSGLTSITIPEGVIYIGDVAFSGCSGLTSITIPSSVTSIGGFAFSHCI